MGLMATRQTEEAILRRAVGLLTVAALIAGATRIARVDCDEEDTVELGLVRQEGPQLVECPSAHLRTLAFAEPGPAADPRQLFDGDPASGVFGACDDLLGDDVVLVLTEPLFAIPNPPQRTAGVAPRTALVVASYLLPEGSTGAVVLHPHGLHRVPGETFTIGCRGEVGDPQVNTKKIGEVLRVQGFNVAGGVQEEHSVDETQIAFALSSTEQLSLPRTTREGDLDTSLDGPDANDLLVHLPGHQAVVVGNATLGTESPLRLLIDLVGVGNLGDGTDGGLGREPKRLAPLMVAEVVESVLSESLGLLGSRTQPVAQGIRRNQGTGKKLRLLRRRKQLDLGDELHISSIDDLLAGVKYVGDFL